MFSYYTNYPNAYRHNKVKLSKIYNCELANEKNIYEELYSRLIKPLYTTFIIAICLLFILKSKSNPDFKTDKIKIYLFGFIFLIFLESSSKFITINLYQNIFISILPWLFILVIYSYFLKTLNVKRI